MNKRIFVLFFIVVTICTVAFGTDAVCQDGENYRLDCNLCKCQDGAFVCSDYKCNWKREAIMSGAPQPLRRLKRGTLTDDLKTTPCAPNDYFKIDCNVCYCNNEGTGYLCTENIGCHKDPESSTANKPLLTNNMLNGDVNNSNDNSISRIGKSGGIGDEKLHQTTTIHGVENTNRNEKALNVPQDRISPKDATPAPVRQTERTPSVP